MSYRIEFNITRHLECSPPGERTCQTTGGPCPATDETYPTTGGTAADYRRTASDYRRMTIALSLT